MQSSSLTKGISKSRIRSSAASWSSLVYFMLFIIYPLSAFVGGCLQSIITDNRAFKIFSSDLLRFCRQLQLPFVPMPSGFLIMQSWFEHPCILANRHSLIVFSPISPHLHISVCPVAEVGGNFCFNLL